ncbi:MAG: TnpV protein [Clostridiales bacterium]|nr:TnpV protein [Clostridiales bacterium]
MKETNGNGAAGPLNKSTLPRRRKPGSGPYSTSLTKYGILMRNFLMLNEPALYLSLILSGRLFPFLLRAQRDAGLLRERLSLELHKRNPPPTKAEVSFLARARYENQIERQIHELIMARIVYRTTD